LVRSPYLKFFFRLNYERARRKMQASRRLVYKFQGPGFVRKRRKFNWRFISIRLTRLYFLTYQDFQFRSLRKKASKLDGNYELNYIRFLEGRLFALLLRLNYSHNVFWLLRFLKTKFNVFINKAPINYPNYLVAVGDLILINRK